MSVATIFKYNNQKGDEMKKGLFVFGTMGLLGLFFKSLVVIVEAIFTLIGLGAKEGKKMYDKKKAEEEQAKLNAAEGLKDGTGDKKTQSHG